MFDFDQIEIQLGKVYYKELLYYLVISDKMRLYNEKILNRYAPTHTYIKIFEMCVNKSLY